jgi:hypothetical protein
MKLPRWVPTWFYFNRKAKDEQIGTVDLPLMEWCHDCRSSHPYPAKDNCPKKRP